MATGSLARVGRRYGAVVAAVVLGSAVPGATAARAASAVGCPVGLAVSGQVAPDGGAPFVVCSGRVPSFDGTPLDTDVAAPAGPTGPVPPVVIPHGWGGARPPPPATPPPATGPTTRPRTTTR